MDRTEMNIIIWQEGQNKLVINTLKLEDLYTQTSPTSILSLWGVHLVFMKNIKLV